jgi:hypothetical protein
MGSPQKKGQQSGGNSDGNAKGASSSAVAAAPAAVRLVAGDVLRGGCLLAAAELQSSKEFIRNDDGSFTTAYYVSASLVFRLLCRITCILMNDE